MDDWQAISQFVQDRSPAAFEHLVRRHVDAIYSAARRQLRDPHLADDVTQAVFIMLAQKAARLRSDVVLSAWLFRATRYACANARRTDARRRRHEQRAAAMRPEHVPPATPAGHATGDSPWSDVEPVLDAAIARLPAGDRDVVVLRYFERREIDDIGRRLGASNQAVRTRLSRAVGRLRKLLDRRGVTVSAAALATGLQAQLVAPAPAGLVSASVAAASGGATLAASSTLAAQIAKGALTLMAEATAKSAAVVVLWVLTLTGATALLVHSVLNGGGDAGLPPTGLAPAAEPGEPTLVGHLAEVRRVLAPATRPVVELTTPAATLRTISELLKADDVDAVMRCTVVSGDADGEQAAMARAIAELMAAHAQYKRVAIDRFGNQVGSWQEPPTLPERIDWVLRSVRPEDVDVRGDFAVMNAPPGLSIDSPLERTPVSFVRTPDGWKYAVEIEPVVIDGETRQPHRDAGWFVDIFVDTAQMWREARVQVEAGGFERFADAEAARVQRWQQIKADHAIRTVQYRTRAWDRDLRPTTQYTTVAR